MTCHHLLRFALCSALLLVASAEPSTRQPTSGSAVRGSTVSTRKALPLLTTPRRGGAIARTATAAPSRHGGPEDASMQAGKVLDCVALIAGTAVGGGFLALPFVTAPAGLLPSAVALTVAWLFLVCTALAMAEGVLDTMARRLEQQQRQSDGEAAVSMFSVAHAAGGQAASALTASLFTAVQFATLIAQDAKAGTFAAPLLKLPFPAAVLVCAIGLAALTFGLPVAQVDRTNTALTGALLLSFAVLVGKSATAGLNPTWLRRCDWAKLLPTAAKATTSGIAWTFPVFLQLLCFHAVIPVVCDRIGPKRRKDARRAIIYGSAIPYVMCLVWATVAIGLVPYDSSTVDPLDQLLTTSAVRAPASALATCAIGTTVISTYLAASQFVTDVLRQIIGECRPAHRQLCRAVVVLLPACLALGGPRVFYLATSFAGAYPLALLYGFCPPTFLLLLRRRCSRAGTPTDPSQWLLGGGNGVLVALASAALSLVLVNLSTLL